MSKCKGCGGEYRKGTTAVLFGQDGSFKPARVCPKCIGRGLTIVASFVPPIVKKVERASDDLNEAASKIAAYLKAANLNAVASGKDAFMQGRVEGLESALAAIKSLSRTS